MVSVMFRDPEMNCLADAERGRKPGVKEEPSHLPCLSLASGSELNKTESRDVQEGPGREPPDVGSPVLSQVTEESV